jgi:hypothetical protein
MRARGRLCVFIGITISIDGRPWTFAVGLTAPALFRGAVYTREPQDFPAHATEVSGARCVHRQRTHTRVVQVQILYFYRSLLSCSS